MRGRAGPALAGGFERRWAGSTDIFKVLSNLKHVQQYLPTSKAVAGGSDAIVVMSDMLVTRK